MMRVKRILKRALKIWLIFDCWVIAWNWCDIFGLESISEQPIILLLLWYILLAIPPLAFIYYVLKELSK